MKNHSQVLKFFALSGLIGILGYGCNTSEDCDAPISISQLMPDNNPPGFEIRVQGAGFTQNAIVHFSNKTAETRFDETQSSLLARVPSGLSGLVEVSVEEGGCLARADFEVTAGPNTDFPPTLTNIVIPQTPSSFPNNFTNRWKNAQDTSYNIYLQGDKYHPVCEGCFELYPANPKLHDNTISGTIDVINNAIHLTVYRAAHGGQNDTLDGRFIHPSATGWSSANEAILLESRVSGRQIVIFR